MNEAYFEELLPELARRRGNLWPFGIGLAEGASNPRDTWTRLTEQLKLTPKDECNLQIFCGYLSALAVNDFGLAESILDDAVESDTLAEYYPALQSSVPISPRDTGRLLYSLKLGKSPIKSFSILSGGRATDPISGADMRKLIGEIAAKPHGFDVAVEILSMRLHSEKDKQMEVDPELLLVGRELMLKMDFGRADFRQDYHLGEIVKACFLGKEGRVGAGHLCSKLKDFSLARSAFASTYDDLLEGLLVAQPAASLDALFPSHAIQAPILILENSFWHRKNPFDSLPETELFGWCDQNPEIRYPLMARAITISDTSTKNGPRRWSKRALRFLEKSPNRVEVLKQYTRQFAPTAWSGSRATAIENNAKLLDEPNEFSDSAVSDFVTSERIRFARLIEAERRIEAEEDGTKDERFE